MFLVIAFLILLVDFYFYNATKSLVNDLALGKYIKLALLLTTVVLLLSLGAGYYYYMSGIPISGKLRGILMGTVFVLFVPRLFALGVFVFDDIIRLFKYIVMIFSSSDADSARSFQISRSKFLQLTGLSVFGVFISIFTYGVLKGGYNYKVIYNKLKLLNLPPQFEGLKIVQISDLHLGSFFSNKPLEEAVSIINEQDADLVFFTGDLVNEISEEALPFVSTLQKIKAKIGIYSVLGNHDYGDYFYDNKAPDILDKKKHNKDLMKSIHKESGFTLLLDESFQLEKEGEEISIIGIENWGAKARFPKYGKLSKAVIGTEKSKVKLLLSHDPSHWDAEVCRDYKDIDVTFSGHTHGMQFGIEIPGFIKWSPVKYLYKQWAGLYKEGGQQLYVNRGLGFIGYPGRVGISPEISVFVLTQEV